ncbi:sulfatase-like hydrolase/transferase [Dactylosporangium aurantiacum]|uniref:Sulfatase-like hydrolase/transferase n=1 Tax=Dactylosporangium aurantiacum TaxID=35754 RepID=A0A9Q9MHU6_9ACTN|nr:sulfatase-like hydrolase/transferase [Dactylosporangium aurantiacum]
MAAGTATTLAALLVLAALAAPNQPGRPFVRIPLEALPGVAAVLLLPGRARRIGAAVAGVALALLTVLKVLDMGFFATFARPFDPMLDWRLFGPAVEVLSDSIGRPGAIGAVAGVVVLVLGLLVLVPLAVLRLTGIVVRHRATSIRTVAWLGCAVFGVQVVTGVPVAATNTAGPVYDHVRLVKEDLGDRGTFAAEASVDAFHGSPGPQLLTALRGKDVVVTFVESYGRDAVQNPEYAPQVTAVLDAGTRQLDEAGFGARSAFLTSAATGGGSHLAHSTLQSGLWVDNQQRYLQLTSGTRFTLSAAFKRAGWRTVCFAPANTRNWPEGRIYGYDKIYDSRNMGYRGPTYAMSSIPDQYTISAFQRLERTAPNRPPLFAEIDLLSSHAPWTPIPRLVDYRGIDDGSTFGGGGQNGVLERTGAQVRADYRQTIEYSLSVVISYLRTYGDDNLVMVFLGDHQPAPVITGENASRDVPVTIVARDPAVLERISGWGWQDGLRPDPQAPVWKMDAFRDRFLTAFGPSNR